MELEATPVSKRAESNGIHVLTLNCWGLKYLSEYRSERLSEIGNRLAAYSPPLDIVALQECWTFKDYAYIRDRTRDVLPHAKFYYSGIFGGGLAIFSRWPLEESSMYRYPLNGRPTAFFRGDWFVGKGVACAKIRMPDGNAIEVFNTHLHAPYEKEPNDSYICHRTAQAWEIAKLMRAAAERGSLVLGLGDFNMVPLSFAHVLIETRGGVKDVWRILRPGSSIGASIDVAERERRLKMGEALSPTTTESLEDHGHTCDSVLNTWRWNKAHRTNLVKGVNRQIQADEEDPRAKRLDYIFFSGLESGWKVGKALVTMTERHPTLLCSLSDHFAMDAMFLPSQRESAPSSTIKVSGVLKSPEAGRASLDVVEMDDKDLHSVRSSQTTDFHLEPQFYQDIIAMIHQYTLRERKQRRYRLMHFGTSVVVAIGSWVGIWWSPSNYVSFILLLVSTLGIMAGTVDGLIGGLFVGSELRALAEFEWEIRNALQLAGGPAFNESPLRDWHD
jgi:sphingomyelin phosphodiesterase 2